MSRQPGELPTCVAGGNSSHQLRPDWSLALAAAWQVAIGLDAAARRSDLLMALQAFLTLPVACTTSVVERSLLRGYLLELARGLRVTRRSAGSGLSEQLEAFCGLIEAPTNATRDLVEPARALIVQIRDADHRSVLNTAEQARALIDRSGNTKLTSAVLGRMLGQNAKSVDRAFRRSYGKTIATYRREREAQAGLDAIARGIPLKKAVDFAGCSESTLRRRIRALTGQAPRSWKGRHPEQVSAVQDA